MLGNFAVTRSESLTVAFTRVPYQKATAASHCARSPCPTAPSPRPPRRIPPRHVRSNEGLILPTAPRTQLAAVGSSPRPPGPTLSTFQPPAPFPRKPSLPWTPGRTSGSRWDPANPSASATRCPRAAPHSSSPTRVTPAPCRRRNARDTRDARAETEPHHAAVGRSKPSRRQSIQRSGHESVSA